MQTIRDIPSAGASIWGAVGQGTGAALQNLANMKMQQVMEQKQAKYAEQGLIASGLDPKVAKQMSYLPPQLLQEAFKYQLKGPQEQALAQAYSSLLGGGQPQEQMQQQQQYAQPTQRTETPQQFTELTRRLAPAMAATSMFGRPGVQPQAQAAAQKQATMQQQAGMPQQQMPGQEMQQATQMPALPKRLNANDFRALTQMYMQKKGMDQKQAMDLAKLDLAKQKQKEMEAYHQSRIGVQEKGMEIRKEQTDIRKEKLTKEEKSEWSKVLTPVAQAAAEAKSKVHDYDEMIKIARTGNVRSPGATQLLEKWGLDAFDRNVETQLIQKFANKILTDSVMAGEAGPRATNFAESILQGKIPSLSNSAEGIQTVAGVSREQEIYKIKKNEELRKYYKEHEGEILPPDYEAEILERLEPARLEIERNQARIIDDAMNNIPQVGGNYDLKKALNGPEGSIYETKQGYGIIAINSKTGKKYLRKLTPQEQQEINALTSGQQGGM